MNIGDIVIIYLAFGAPFAVHRYLQTRGEEMRRRITISIFTLLFWVPTATRLVYLYLNNAYSRRSFVSRQDLDSPDVRLAVLRDAIRRELNKSGFGPVTSFSIRETVERYIGLTKAAAATQDTPRQKIDDVPSDLFEVAGRSDDKLAAICLNRRNRRQMERHHIKGRRDFLTLFEQASALEPIEAQRAVELGLELARQLNDRKAVEGLEAIAAQIRDEVWNPDDKQVILGNVSPTMSRLAMKTAPLNND